MQDLSDERMKRSLIAKLTVLCLLSQWHYRQSFSFIQYIFCVCGLFVTHCDNRAVPEEVRDELAAREA
jgi:hypothetical protein